jgi:hypothetical protein
MTIGVPRLKNTEIVLLPKQLRAEWGDALAVDLHLSDSAYRVAGVISSHFNRHHGYTTISQDTIARMTKKSTATVWRALAELERRGYLSVQRRDTGTATSSGRRICGGRGIANVYLPSFNREQISENRNGQKLREAADRAWEERSSPVNKVITSE